MSRRESISFLTPTARHTFVTNAVLVGAWVAVGVLIWQEVV